MKKLIILFLLFSLKGVSQDLRLFENTWYLHDIVIDGVSNIPPINDEIPYVPAEFFENGDIFTGMCENSGSGELDYIGTIEFIVLEMNFLQGQCYQNNPQNQDYSNLYQNFWSLGGSGEIPYEITEEGQTRTLIITKPNDDYAIYKNEIPLTTNRFVNPKFTVYPNPVKETLHINNTSNQTTTATIYDVSGKQLLSHSLGNSLSSIDVSALKQGLHFMAFESESGERVSKKFIKK